MTSRMTMALGLILALVGPSLAQTRGAGPVQQFPGPDMMSVNPATPAVELVEDGAAPASWAEQIWVRGDYLAGWVNRMHLPPLLTTSSTTDFGILGAPTTSILLGNNSVAGQLRNGGRFETGYYSTAMGLGIEDGFFYLPGVTQQASVSSDGTTPLFRPIFDASTGAPTFLVVAFPGITQGTLSESVNARAFFGGNLDLSKRLIDTESMRLTVMVGYRYLQYGDSLQVNEQVTFIGGAVAPGTQIAATDAFSVRNEFNGAEVGGRFQYFWNSWSVDLLAKVAPGRNNREISINGSTTITPAGGTPMTSPGGVLALSSNSGTTFSNIEAVFAEFGGTLGWSLNDHLRFRLGYNFMYWTNVVRAGDQVDLTINRNLLPPTPVSGGPVRPSVNVQQSNLWAQIISAGIEFRY